MAVPAQGERSEQEHPRPAARLEMEAPLVVVAEVERGYIGREERGRSAGPVRVEAAEPAIPQLRSFRWRFTHDLKRSRREKPIA